ncbi:Transposase [Cordylochernes scorpioides]|uniref:Transposase n=1 Tax=Cordylochernes scorpioides TaxID=51811 RepID=A0ABY6LKE2_9ARAC|nr:Transposase [Cordylochernes scorpioides]
MPGGSEVVDGGDNNNAESSYGQTCREEVRGIQNSHQRKFLEAIASMKDPASNDPILDSEITNADIYKEIAEFGDIHLLLYADDIAIIGESRINLQKKIKILKEYLDENLMTLNESKSKIMVFRNGGHDNHGHRKWRQFKQTDAFTRGMVIGLKRAGWSIRQIAADTHLGASTVHRLWRRWLEQGNVAIYRNVGATRVTSARVDRRILRQAVAAPQATCTAILQHVQDTLDHSISTRTISRRLVANGLHSCRPLRRLPLTPPNRRQRLEWCRARSTSMTEWHRVVFSDESRFCLSSDSRRVRVWHRRGERSNPAAIGVPNALYQQDNARPHTARISQQALQDVQMLPWPPYSPDLSPIEHVWDIIGRRLHALPQPRSEEELWQMVEREWRAIPQDAIRTLIDSLPRRVAACIAVRGGPTCY